MAKARNFFIAFVLLVGLGLAAPMTLNPSPVVLTILWYSVILSAIGVLLTWKPITRRLPYRVIKRSEHLSNESIQAYWSARQRSRQLTKRLKSKIRAGTELLGDCRRAADGITGEKPGLLSGPGLRSRVDKWTSDTEKLLENGPDSYTNRFHKIATQMASNESVESQRLLETMNPRLAILKVIVEEQEANETS